MRAFLGPSVVLAAVFAIMYAGSAAGQGSLVVVESLAGTDGASGKSEQDVLTPTEWKQVDQSIGRSLSWLANQQQRNGSFPTARYGQPGVTALCTMAFLANGHRPDVGPYGKTLRSAVDFVMQTQKPHGLLAVPANDGLEMRRQYSHHVGKAVAYNHAIGALMLSEVHGMSGDSKDTQLARKIELAIKASLKMRGWEKSKPVDRGGWRYAHDDAYADSDLSLRGGNSCFCVRQ